MELYLAGAGRQNDDGYGYQTLSGSLLRAGSAEFDLAWPMMALAQPGGQSGPLHTRRCQDLPAGLREPGARIAASKLKNETPSIVKNNCLEVISFSPAKGAIPPSKVTSPSGKSKASCRPRDT